MMDTYCEIFKMWMTSYTVRHLFRYECFKFQGNPWRNLSSSFDKGQYSTHGIIIHVVTATSYMKGVKGVLLHGRCIGFKVFWGKLKIQEVQEALVTALYLPSLQRDRTWEGYESDLKTEQMIVSTLSEQLPAFNGYYYIISPSLHA